MQDLYPPFVPGETYHVYNHANGDDDIFREDDNYRYFLEKYIKFISPIAETYAYCLMKNHFHMMLRVKADDQLSKSFKVFENLEGLCQEAKSKLFQKKVSQSFSNFFNAYTKAFNIKYERRGSLFVPRVKRKQITSDAYYTQCLVYVHQNPVHHGFVDFPEDWLYSSYWGVVNGNDTIVPVNEVLEWFGGLEEFIEAHKSICGLKSVFE